MAKALLQGEQDTIKAWFEDGKFHGMIADKGDISFRLKAQD
jgi:hypothetical protein